MTVIDSSAALDLLLDRGTVREVREFLGSPPAAAPDVLLFELLAVCRRHLRRGVISAERAQAMVDDLATMPIELFRSMPLRRRAWELRDNFSTADALFVALAERLDEPLLTADLRLARGTRRHTGVEAIGLAA